MKNILVLAPLSQEVQWIEKSFESLEAQSVEEKVGHLRVKSFPKLGLRLAQGGHGKTQFAIQAQFLISHYSSLNLPVDLLVCAGCAGALAPSVDPLDVVIATYTLEHDFHLKFVQRAQPEFLGAKEWIQKTKGFEPLKFRTHFGPIASGDEDVIDGVRAAELWKRTNALAVAWEGAGGARSARFNRIDFLEVRGITDQADDKATVHFEERLGPAMAHVTEVLKFLAE